MDSKQKQPGLYGPCFEYGNRGIGVVVNIKGLKTHETADQAFHIAENLEHGVGKDAGGKTGDGMGIMLQISHSSSQKVTEPLGIYVEGKGEYGVGMSFSPQDELVHNQAMKMLEIIVEKEGLTFLGWRVVPTTPEVLGERALEVMPCIAQGSVIKPEQVKAGLDFDRKSYVVRWAFEQSNEDTYVVSLSSRTIVYKGMFLVGELKRFFQDLQDKDYRSVTAIVHSRFSINTNPNQMRVHPYHFIVHNGEINAIRGNADKMVIREENMESGYFKYDMHKVLPIISQESSDLAMLDSASEFMVMGGMDLILAVMVTIPAPWEYDKYMDGETKDFYRYYAITMEPWDGPASILSMDGDVVGVVLDRNGLRPSWYYTTKDGYIILASEVGAIDIDQTKVVRKDCLRPGKMLLVDTKKGEIIDDDRLKHDYASKKPYGEWLDSSLIDIKELSAPNRGVLPMEQEQLLKLQKTYGYTYEQYKTAILSMALNGAKAASAIGVDSPLTVLFEKHQPLFNYFKQLFTQATSPPIDAIREEVVTSTMVYMGEEGNTLEETLENCKILKVGDSIPMETDLLKIKNMKKPGFKVERIPITYYKSTPLERAIDRLFLEVDRAHRDGANIITLSDRDIDENYVPAPSLLAVSTLQQYLVRTKKCTGAAPILEGGEPREVHHFITLLGYGACAINSCPAHESICSLIGSGMLDEDYYAAVMDYDMVVPHGIVKIASKMGISTIQSYQGAQILETIGIPREVVDRYLTDIVSRVGGIILKDIVNDVDTLHSVASDPLGLDVDLTLDSVGSHKSRFGQEAHLYNPLTIHLFQEAARTGNYETFKQYTSEIDRDDKVYHLRFLMEFDLFEDGGILLDEVESVDSIVRWFKIRAMSYGSIFQEAHECLTIAMNQVHGKSNTGEGGESPDHLTPGPANRN